MESHTALGNLESARNLWGGVVKPKFFVLGTAALALAATGLVFAQDSSKTAPKKTAAKGSPTKGKEVFDQKCSMCHNADSDAKKVGPGLKGIGKRGTFTVNGNKVTDETLKSWIENGDSLMPPFKDVIDEAQIRDVIAYVKTL
jgi:cytochrome c